MKTKMNDFLLDESLLLLFKEISDDEAGYNEMVRDAKRAFSFIRRNELKRNQNYDFNNYR